MNSKLSIIASLTLIPIILSIGIIPNISFVDALQERDAETECRDGQVLVFRTIANNYVCVSESTAKRWVDLGIAEIVVPEDESMEETTDESMEETTDESMEETTDESMEEKSSSNYLKYLTGTIESVQDPGIGHESHQLAVLLPPSDNVYMGQLTFSASEPVQYVALHGPLGEGEDNGQPIWTPDGETKFALTLVDQELSSGGWFFAGNALALHSMNDEPFVATYSISYVDLPVDEYPKGVVQSGTINSEIDPGIGHESHSLAILLPPSDSAYHDGILSYSASEPIQLVALHGPLGEGEDNGQPIWTPDGETKFALTFVNTESNMGTWTFTGNALAAHTMNPDGFTISYSVATRN